MHPTKTNLQIQVYTSLPHAISAIYKEEKIRGFYRGLGPSITQIMPYMGLMFFSYEGLCSIVQRLKVKAVVVYKCHTKKSDRIMESFQKIIKELTTCYVDH